MFGVDMVWVLAPKTGVKVHFQDSSPATGDRGYARVARDVAGRADVAASRTLFVRPRMKEPPLLIRAAMGKFFRLGRPEEPVAESRR